LLAPSVTQPGIAAFPEDQAAADGANRSAGVQPSTSASRRKVAGVVGRPFSSAERCVELSPAACAHSAWVSPRDQRACRRRAPLSGIVLEKRASIGELVERPGCGPDRRSRAERFPGVGLRRGRGIPAAVGPVFLEMPRPRTKAPRRWGAPSDAANPGCWGGANALGSNRWAGGAGEIRTRDPVARIRHFQCRPPKRPHSEGRVLLNFNST